MHDPEAGPAARGGNAAQPHRDRSSSRCCANAFEAVLELAPGSVGPDEDFFDLGGHSLAAAELAARVEDAFDETVSMPQFAERPTVEGLLALLEARRRGLEAAPSVTRPREDLVERLAADAALGDDVVPPGLDGGGRTDAAHVHGTSC